MRCPRLLLLVFGLLLLTPAPARAGDLRCTGDPAQVQRLDLAVGGEPTYGTFVAPVGTPRTLVVFAHGYSYNAPAWREHLKREARRLGVLALAMNYRGLRDLPPDARGYERSRGWPVKKGGEDLVAAAQLALRTCPSLRHVVLYGVSMGANSSGLALAAKPRRPDGSPLFDLWIAIEGVHNLTELYQGARLLAPANAFAAQAKEDIEAETGGTPETAPAAYRERTNTFRAADIAASGIKGAVLVHGRDDASAPYHFSQEMTRALRVQRIRTDLYTIQSRGPDDDKDTNLLGGPGHASEVSQNHVVIDTGFDRLAGLLAREEPPPCDRDFTVEGRDDTVAPNPAQPAAGCPRGPLLPGATAGTQPPPAALCAPERARVRSLRTRRLGRGLRVRGRAARSTCRGGGAMRVEVAVARRTALGRCRFVLPGRRLSGPRSCERPRWLRARGSTTWSLRLLRVPRGRIEIRVRAVDRRGHGPLRRRVRR